MLIDVHTHQTHDWFSVQSVHAEDFLNDNFPREGFYTVGLHPWFANPNTAKFFSDKLMEQLPENLIGIGECGLDRIKGTSLEVQKEVFEVQLNMASKLNLPVIIHQVRTISDILPFIKHFSTLSFVLHGFNGNVQQMQQLLTYRVYFSFGAAILKDRPKLSEVISRVPVERVFFETDESNESIRIIYDTFADLAGYGTQELEDRVKRTFYEVFKRDTK